MDNETYMTKMASSFLAELSEIEKQSFDFGAAARGVGSFFGKGARHIKSAITQKTPMGMTTAGGLTRRVGGEGAVAAGGIGKHIKQIYQRGAQGTSGLAGAAGPMMPGMTRGGGVLGGLKQVAGSRYGRMAAVGAVPLAAGYALS